MFPRRLLLGFIRIVTIVVVVVVPGLSLFRRRCGFASAASCTAPAALAACSAGDPGTARGAAARTGAGATNDEHVGIATTAATTTQ